MCESQKHGSTEFEEICKTFIERLTSESFAMRKPFRSPPVTTYLRGKAEIIYLKK